MITPTAFLDIYSHPLYEYMGWIETETTALKVDVQTSVYNLIEDSIYESLFKPSL